LEALIKSSLFSSHHSFVAILQFLTALDTTKYLPVHTLLFLEEGTLPGQKNVSFTI